MDKTTETTYTFTARSSQDPARVATFTLLDGRVSVDLGVPFEQLETLLEEEEPGQEQERKPWMRPLLVSLAQRKLRPFRLADVEAHTKGDRLKVRAWTRVAGLRLAPIDFSFEAVDNPSAAHDFVRELHHRQHEKRTASASGGLFDYWIGWAAAFLGVLLFFRRWRRA
ncbi:MAG: hypothetical protein P8X64_01465 [Anaerolineales bacterium]